MWVRNTETGKWFKQTETLIKDNFESLKVDLERVKLYSKCLSGATYLTINDFDDIYPQLKQEKIGFYTTLSPNFRGPAIQITNDNENEFYEKYLKEDAFSLKTLFTPEKLLKDQGENIKYVDVATTAQIEILPSNNIIIDGVQLIKGHRLLVKDQKSTITLSNIDEEDYFTNVLPVSSYTHSVFETTTKTYEYYSPSNGVYSYDGYNLTKTTDLSTYETAYKSIFAVKLGTENSDKQFHLERLKNGYFPIEGESVEFRERVSWVLRHRVDYNNVFETNFYDIKYFPQQTIFDKLVSKTYTIPERVIAVGDFGIILNNQDQLEISATYSISNLIRNKYKVNLRSIEQVSNYYWVCGDEGILLKISKIDFSIEQIDLGEDLNFTSVSFFGDLYGVVVGKFNTIYYTRDGGFKWFKVQYDEFSIYSYNKVLHHNENEVYIIGESGLFIELVYSNGEWLGYRRTVSKELSKIDFYPLVEDLNDIQVTDFVNLQSTTFSFYGSTTSVFENSIVYNTRLNGDSHLEISVNSDIFNTPSVELDYINFFISFSIQHPSGFSYSALTFASGTFDSYDLSNQNGLFSATFGLPTFNSNILSGVYDLSIELYHNYNYQDPLEPLEDYVLSYYNYSLKTSDGPLFLMSGNNETVVCYDKRNIIDKSNNDFIFLSFTQSFGDSMAISKRPNSNEVYLGGSSLYKFKIAEFGNISDSKTNSASGTLTLVENYFVNKIFTTENRIYLAGNSSLLKTSQYDIFSDLDPTYVERLDSKFLILDYDIGSKLNFFDDNGQYRLPTPVDVDLDALTVSNAIFSIESLSNEKSWIDYFSDSEKTFIYNTHLEDSNVVKFSNQFHYDPYHTSFTLSTVDMGLTAFSYGVGTIAPHFDDGSNSEFIKSGTISNTFQTPYDILLHKNLAIIKRSYLTTAGGRTLNDFINLSDKTQIGDVLLFSSDVVETKLLVNKVLYYTSNSTTGQGTFTQSKPTSIVGIDRFDTLIYAYTDFNENILNNLKKTTSQTKTILVKNLNRYKDQDDLVSNFNSHRYGIGFKMTKNTNSITINALFNEKTAYYNMQALISDSTTNHYFKYKTGFLDFGFTPTYNILTFLNKINSQVFVEQKEFKILPRYFDLKGNNKNDATTDNVFINSNLQSNVLRFGKDLYLQWKSFIINTFIDIVAKTTSGEVTFKQYLITEKYYDTATDAYYLKFHKKINLENGLGVLFFNILTRNTLVEISQDLQLLNNIHRSSNSNTILWKSGNSTVAKTFTNYESSIKTKFSTESYLKAFVSDYDIKQNVSAILYNDNNFEPSLNILNLEKELTYTIGQIQPDGIDGRVTFLIYGAVDELKVGELIFLEIFDVTNSPMEGYQTITSVNSNFVKTSKIYDYGQSVNNGRIKITKKDPFFNFQPVDIFRSGSDRRVTRSVEVLPKNTKLDGSTYYLIDLNLNKFKIEFVDGLSLEEVAKYHHWVLEAEISNALIGKNDNGIIWYSGTWRCGRWFGEIWHSGRWLSGDWYGGVWNAFNVQNNIISAKVDESFSDQRLSIWYSGRWFTGTWNNGIWYNGRRYDGDWRSGTWFNGIWNDGIWYNGRFLGGVWVNGTWQSGTFNCDNKPAYWIFGEFKSGDFENGMWYNGVFGNQQRIQSRFGTRANNSRTATWHSGKWIDGEFHSFLNIDIDTALPTVSDIHKFSVWRTGIWTSGNWYGGIAYNIDFRGGIWHGGILEEIQVIGIDYIIPYQTSKNKIYLNGIFKFNPGDEIWIIDDDRNSVYSPIGSNTTPRKYRINQIEEDDVKKQTALYLNYNLSMLGVPNSNAVNDIKDTDLGLRVVSYFKDIQWKSGLWTNGIFDGSKFDSGIWFNGIFDGIWGN